MESVSNDGDEILNGSYENQQDNEGSDIIYAENVVEENDVLDDGTPVVQQDEAYVEEDVHEEYISNEQSVDYHEEHAEELEENTITNGDEQNVYHNDQEQQNEEIVYDDQEEEEVNYTEGEQYPEQIPEDENVVAYKEGYGDEIDEENVADQGDEIEDAVQEHEVESENMHDASFEEVQYNENSEEEIVDQEHDATYESVDDVEQHETIENEAADDSENMHQEQEELYPAVQDTSEEIVEPEEAVDENMYQPGGDKSAEDDDDYEDVVEVEEDQLNEEGEDENVAQHESDSDDEQDGEAIEEHEKLDHISDYDVRDSDEEVADDETFGNDGDKPNDEVSAKMLDSDSDDEKEKEGVGDLIADIFGKSDDEDEEFTGFGEEESSASKKNKSLGAVITSSEEEEDEVSSKKPRSSQQEDSSSDEGVRDGDKGSGGMVYDFDLMLQRKKEERKGRRRKDGGTFISDADDIINAMLTKMREAAVTDREANQIKKPALNKLKMLPTVVRHLKKQDLKEAFVDMGMIAAIADWLTLLPDRSLPHISIRAELLEVLHDLPAVSPETLKSSGIGRAVMVLFKHPRETRKHKESAGRLINKWSRPIFGLNENFKSMSRGEREQRDLAQMPQSKRRKLSSGRSDAEKSGEPAPEPGQLRPGERGFVMRARVPMPSNKDYVIRPKSRIEEEDEESPRSFSKRAKPKKDERLEKHLKTFADRRKNLKMQRAVGISIEGNKMPLT